MHMYFKYTHVAGSGNTLHLQNCQISHSFIAVPNSPSNLKAAKTNQLRSLISCHRQKQNTNPLTGCSTHRDFFSW